MKHKTAGIKFTQRLKINHHFYFRPTGATRCTDSREIWHAEGYVGPLGCSKFHISRCMHPHKSREFTLFGKFTLFAKYLSRGTLLFLFLP